jgi:hypothetical protein
MLAFICTYAVKAPAQTNAGALLAQLSQAISGGFPLKSVTLTGTAIWYGGNREDSGSATLTASAAGAATMQLSLATKGSWTESQSDFGIHAACQWMGNDGAAHEGDRLNCFRPVNWFLPSISLQPTLFPAGVGAADLGTSIVGIDTYRHLQTQAVLAEMPSKLLLRSVQASTTDVGMDPNTLLPRVLRYQVHPDDGGLVEMTVEIRYSDYHKVDGVEIPFMIERYINGSLQLEIHLSSAQIS